LEPQTNLGTLVWEGNFKLQFGKMFWEFNLASQCGTSFWGKPTLELWFDKHIWERSLKSHFGTSILGFQVGKANLWHHVDTNVDKFLNFNRFMLGYTFKFQSLETKGSKFSWNNHWNLTWEPTYFINWTRT
jgi:hypothetical protein